MPTAAVAIPMARRFRVRTAPGRGATVPRPRRRVWRWALTAVAALLLLAGVGYAAASLYLATQTTVAHRKLAEGTPVELGLAYEPVAFISPRDGIRLEGWYLPAGGERAVILVHGIHGNRWDRFHHMPELARILVEARYDVLTFDARAHGASGGERFGLGWYERQDLRAATDFVLARGLPAGRIGIWAQSFGTLAALLGAPDLPEIGALALDSAIADVRPLLDSEISRQTGAPPVFTPGVTVFAGWLYGLDLDAIPPVKAVPRIAPRPLLFVHGDADDRVPVEHSRRLKALARGPADELWVVADAGHVLAFETQPEEYAARLLRFFGGHLQ